MANPYSSLNRRPGAAQSGLFANYPGSRPSSTPASYGGYHSHAQPQPQSQDRTSSPYQSQSQSNSTLYNGYNGTTPPPNAASAYSTPSNPSRTNGRVIEPANPYTSTAVLEHLESQNANENTSMLSSKVSQLKQLSLAIGEEIRDSSKLADTINEGFEGTSVRLKGTMKRMLRMAERTGVGWKVWLLFFLAVWAVFVYVWLF